MHMREKAIAALAVLMMSTGIAFGAQQQGGMGGQQGRRMGGQMHGRMGRMNVDQRVARMKADLNLSDKQADRVKKLFEKQQRDMRSWRDNHSQATRAEMRAHRRQMMNDMEGGLKKILTPEQFKKHQAMMKKRMRRGMRNRPPGPPRS